MNRCTGMLGKQCTCGYWHGTARSKLSLRAVVWITSAIACGLLYAGAYWWLA